MVGFDAVHPPAVSTALSFGFRDGEVNTVMLFCLAVGVTAVLVVIERASLFVLIRNAQDKSLAGR